MSKAVQGDLSAHYVLGNNINASETETWNSGAGFTPIGNGVEFSGDFDGQGYSVDGLYINRPNTNGVGLFGGISSSDIKNIGVTNIDIQGGYNVGGLVGDNNNGANIMYSYSSGAVSGDSAVGGLVGNNNDGTVVDSNWNTETSNQATSGGSAIGLTTAYMTGSEAAMNMVGFDFTSVWSTVSASDADSSADSYPILDSVDRKAQLVSADVYDAPTYTVDVLAVDSEGNEIDNATITIDGTETSTSDLTDGTYTISASAESYDTLNKYVTVDGADKTVAGADNTVIFILSDSNTDDSNTEDGTTDDGSTGDILTRPKGRGFLQGKPRRRRFQN